VRTLLTQIEELESLAFVFLVAAIGGVLKGVPALFLGNSSLPGVPVVALFLVGTVVSLFWLAASILLWWIAIRRRRYSIWQVGFQLMLAWALADVLQMALLLVAGSFATKGAIVEIILHAPLSQSSTSLLLVLIQSPIRFLGAAGLVAFGRFLLTNHDPVAPHLLMATDPEAVA